MALIISVLLLIPMSFVQTPLQLGIILRFLLGAADGALRAGGANPAGVQLDQPDLRANLQL